MANSELDVARALKDQGYFNSLTDEEKAIVRAANPVGEANLDNQDLDSVSGGLEGGDVIASTTTTTDLKQCSCSSETAAPITPDCGCAC